MKNKLLGVLVVSISALLIQSCRPMALPEGDVPAPHKDTFRKQLIERREAIRKWAFTFPDGVASETDPANCNLAQDPGCGNGDTTSWNGYGCLAAFLAGDRATEDARCNDIKNSQSPDGRWWRGPHKVGIAGEDTFSRDMSMGLIAYFLVKQDRAAANRWMDYMWSIGKWVGTGASKEFQIRLCPDASDSRCTPVGPLYGVWFYAWDAMKFPLKAISEDPSTNKDDPLKKMYDWEMTSLLMLESEVNGNIATAKATPGLSFQLHLSVISLWIRQAAGKNNEKVQSAANAAASAFPENPFFEFVAKGATEHAITRVLNDGICPAESPVVTHGRHDLYFDWLWQRNTDEWGVNQHVSSGHDCIFMINLLLAGLNQ